MNINSLLPLSSSTDVSVDKNTLFQFLDHFIRQMPGFVALKTPDSVYASANSLCAKLAGYSDVDSYIGKTDYDWKCDAVVLADKIRAQDQLVIKNGQKWSSFNVIQFALGRTYYFSNKSAVYYPNGELLGVLFIGTMIADLQILKILNALIKIDPRQSDPALESSVYVTGETPHVIHLSIREEECLFYLIRGKSSKEIARFLNISPRTVETHIDQIKYKFSCNSRSELFLKAVEAGYLYYIPPSLLKNKSILESLL